MVSSQTGADHIVSQQCGNGGWGWPHNDCSATYNNITAPICLGLLEVYPNTLDPDHLNSAIAGGGYDLTSQYGNGEARFGTFAPYFLMRLSAHTQNPLYSNWAATEFFDELSAGTYGPSDLNTAGWIAAVQAGRAGTWNNLLPWEFHTLIPAAASIGNPGQDAAFRQALLDGLNTLDNTQPFVVYSDLIGLAGGVRGLAMGGTTSFPAINSPLHSGINGISTLKDLADKLVSYQNVNGSWCCHSNIPGPVALDEDTQTTAYAVLALMAADPRVTSDYSVAIANGRAWINSMQLPSGGFLSYPGGLYEDTETEGEALTATADPPKPICGDGRRDNPEQCDDGNLVSGDGCSATCQLEICGDNLINQPSEQCDGTATPLCPSGSYCATNCTCIVGIPAVSEWGLAVLTLIGLVSGTILFGRRREAVH